MTAPASSDQIWVIEPVSPGPPITTAGSWSSCSTGMRTSSSRRSLTNTPSTRRSPHQRRYTSTSCSGVATTCSVRAYDRAASSASKPLIRPMKNGSMPRMRAGRHRVRPTALALAPESARAALLGLKPISRAMATIRCRVASDTPGWPLRAYDTAPLETPARWAMSAIVGRCFTRSPLLGTVERSHATSLLNELNNR